MAGERLWLQPDLAAAIATREYIDRWFIEVDLGTESLPTLLKKCDRYEAYRATGAEEEAGRSFPLVLFLFADTRRADRLAQAISQNRGLTPELYRVVTPAELTDTLRGGGQ